MADRYVTIDRKAYRVPGTNDDDLIDFLIKEEGFLSKPTDIGDKKITLGSGLTDPKWHQLYRQRGNKWSKEDNRMAVAQEVAKRRKDLETTMPNWSQLGPNAQKAMLAYYYNYNFTPENSPNMYQAMREGRFRDAVLEMDATSTDPKFQRGLAERRKREQAWGLQDYPLELHQTLRKQPAPLPSSAAPAVSTAVAPRYTMSTPQPVMIPRQNQYVAVDYDREARVMEDALSGLRSLDQYNKLMSLLDWNSQPQSQFAPTGVSLSYSSGGQMKKRRWGDLSMKERADLMGIAVRSGITSLDTIRDIYNEYAEGGSIHIDPSKKGTFTAAASKHGKSVQAFASQVLAHPENYSPAMRKKANFARNSAKWKHSLGGQLYEEGGEMGQYNNPETFAGRMAQVAGASPSAVRGWDVASSIAQMTPYGIPLSVLDLGRDLNRAYHKEEGAKKDVALDALSLLPFVSKMGLKVAPGMLNGIRSKLQPARILINVGVGSGRIADFVNDTWGANEATKALGGPLVDRAMAHYYDGTSEDSQQMSTMPWQNVELTDDEAQMLEWERHPLGHMLNEVAVVASKPESMTALPQLSPPRSEFVETLSNTNQEEFSPQVYQTEEIAVPFALSKPVPKSYRTLELDNTLFNNAYLSSGGFDNDIHNKLLNMNKDEVMSVQNALASQGYYDVNPDNMTEKEIKGIQSKLYKKGLLTGERDKAVDDVWGPKTKQAWREYNIDGIPGQRTLDAFKAQYSPQARWKEDVSTANTEWCAQWVTKKVKNASGEMFGVSGDAWTMPQNIVNAGGEMLYNVYNNSEFSNLQDVNSLKRTTERMIKEHPFDISQLQLGDVVGIYMPSSDMHQVALQSGTTYNTHVGVVTGFDKDGTPIIEHNIHKKHHKDKANHLTGSMTGTPKIATVSRPAYAETNIPTLYTESMKSPYVTEEDNPLFAEYANSIAGSKEVLSKIFPNADIDEAELAALAVQGRETNFMNTRGSTLEGVDKLKYELRKAYRDKYKKTDPEAVSSDLSKMKLSSFSPNERHLLGLRTPEDLNNPQLAGRAALYMMAKNYDYFKRLQTTYPELGLDNDDLRYLTELSYNQGMKILSSIGFKENGGIDLSEIEKIRAMAAEDAKVKDISSTNYKYLGAVGKFLYDKFGSAHTPYISAAEKNRRKLLAKTRPESDLLTLND